MTHLASYAAAALIFVVFAIGGGTPRLVGAGRHDVTSGPSPRVSGRAATHGGSFRDVMLPAGTELPVTLVDSVSSATSRADDPVRARVTNDVVIDGLAAIPKDSEVVGTVVSPAGSSRLRPRTYFAIRFDSLAPDGMPDWYDINSVPVTRMMANQGDEVTITLMDPLVVRTPVP